MILVLPFCSKDADLQRRNLEWMLELDSGCGREGVLAYDTATPVLYVEQIKALAQRYFTKVHHCRYQEPPVKGWPAACNWAWQSTARWMFESSPKQPWLWLEADATPLKSGWLLTLEKAHQEGGKAFGGHVVKDMGHMNGVGIYPWDVMRRNEMAMLARAAAWDVVLKPSTQSDCVPLNHLIQHAWNVHPIDRAMIWNGEGSPLSFKSQDDVALWMDFNAVLIHRVKDGSLIPLLREKHRAEQEKQRLIMSTEYNVPQHTKAVAEATEVQKQSGNILDATPKDAAVPERHGRRDPKTEILIVTYAKDFKWLEYCLKLIDKYCSGFQGVTVAHPVSQRKLFYSLHNRFKFRLRLHEDDEPEGKGMLWHMAKMAQADHIVEPDAEFVMHLDADCMYHTPTTPADYFTDGRPDYLVRSWESLKDGNGVVSDCAQWFKPTMNQLGFKPQVYSMCRHPTVFPIKFYALYRHWIQEAHPGVSFMDYMLSGRNAFPQDRMDWTAMGAFAYEFMRDEFNWIDVGAPGAVVPKDRQRTHWSHGGIKPEIKAEIEGFLK